MPRVRWHGDREKRLIMENARRLLDVAAVMVQGEMKMMLSRPGSGRLYPGNPTRSSAPGEPPAAQTGTLRRSIQIDRSRNVGVQPVVRIGTNLLYGLWLEFGTRGRSKPLTKKQLAFLHARLREAGIDPSSLPSGNNGKIAPRPWARPSLRKAAPKVLQLFSTKRLTEGIFGAA